MTDALTLHVIRELDAAGLDSAAREAVLLKYVQGMHEGLSRTFEAFTAVMFARDRRIAEDLSQRYGVAVDPEVIAVHTRKALAGLAQYDPEKGRIPGGQVFRVASASKPTRDVVPRYRGCRRLAG